METKIIENLETDFLGKKIEYFENIDSTHNYVKKLPDEKLENGMIILAENQTSGVGTHGRKWHTEKGKNLTFNIVLIPNCDIKKIEKLTIVIAKCIVRSLEKLYNIKTNIKEPNDIILNGKKLAGILTESISQGKIIKKIYIGIGINVNQEFFNDEIEKIATSLKKEFKKDFSKTLILKSFLEIFEKEYIKLIK